MKNHITKIFAVLALSVTAVACSEEAPVVNGESFEIQTFEDFLWHKDAVDTIKFEISTEFRECEEVTKPITLALCDCNGTIVPTDVATVFVNGVESDDNKIKITPKNGLVETQIAIVLDHSALTEDCEFSWNLQSLEGEDGIKVLGVKDEETEIGLVKNGIIFGTDIHIKNTHVANTLKVWSITGLWIILAALIAAHILSRVINRPVKFTNVKVGYDDDQMRSYTTRGCYMVVFTNKPYKVSLFHRFFVGKVAVIKDSFWTEEVILKNLFGQNLMLRTKGDYILPDEPLRKEEFIIKNEEGRIATLRTN